MSAERTRAASLPASVSTHILDTSLGRPARGVAVRLSARAGPDGAWVAHGTSSTDAEGRCKNLPDLPEGTSQARLLFEVEPYHSGPGSRGDGGFFPEVVITFTVNPGEHYHMPLLLNPYGYSVYRGS